MPRNASSFVRRAARFKSGLRVLLACCAGGHVVPVTVAQPDSAVAATSRQAVELSGRPVDPLQAKAKAVVLVFIANDCPISNRYAPEIQRLATRFRPQGIVFWLVHPNADETVAEIREHDAAYRYSLGILRDPGHVLVRRAKCA